MFHVLIGSFELILLHLYKIYTVESAIPILMMLWNCTRHPYTLFNDIKFHGSGVEC